MRRANPLLNFRLGMLITLIDSHHDRGRKKRRERQVHLLSGLSLVHSNAIIVGERKKGERKATPTRSPAYLRITRSNTAHKEREGREKK